MKIITRFAPSPSGFLHIGGARTALFNYLFAKKYNGKFLLRIEDTDRIRSTQTAIQAIVNGLNWLKLKPDEEIIYQSKNITRHYEVSQQLLKRKFAYKCYLTEIEQKKIREDSLKKGTPFRSPWRHKQEDLSSPFVLRLRMPDNGHTIINDLVQGKVEVLNKQLDDLILLRSDGTPTYMLAVVVDDYDMNISHVIRGDDHLNNAIRQYWIYNAMGWKIPKFAHIPLIHGEDGTKLSKRHGALGIDAYDEMGFLPEALNSYLLKLGWSSSNDRIIDQSEAIKNFTIEKIGRSPSKFDLKKLKHVNSHFLKIKKYSFLIDKIINKNKEVSAEASIRLQQALPFLLERSYTLIDLIELSLWICTDDYNLIFTNDLPFTNKEKNLLDLYKHSLISIIDWTKKNIEEHLQLWLIENQIEMKEIGKPLRLCLTGTGSSMDLNNIIYILGYKEIVKRIDYNLL